MWLFILLQVFSVLAIIVFLRVLLHKQLEMGYKRIQMLDHGNLKKETDLNTRIKQLEDAYQSKLAEAQQQSQSMIEVAKEEIKKMKDDERGKAKEESKRTIASALQQREKVIRESEQLVFNKSLDLAMDIVRQVLSDKELKDLRCKVTKDVLNSLVDSEQAKDALKTNQEVEIISADVLSGDDRKYVSQVINKISGNKAKVDFSADKDITGGIVLKIGDRMIDGSLAYRINKAAQAIKEGGSGNI